MPLLLNEYFSKEPMAGCSRHCQPLVVSLWELPQIVTSPWWCHYIDGIMSAMASQIISLTIVYSIVYSGVDQRKHQSPTSLAFVWGISPVPGEFPVQRATNAENISIWWRRHVFWQKYVVCVRYIFQYWSMLFLSKIHVILVSRMYKIWHAYICMHSTQPLVQSITNWLLYIKHINRCLMLDIWYLSWYLRTNICIIPVLTAHTMLRDIYSKMPQWVFRASEYVLAIKFIYLISRTYP